MNSSTSEFIYEFIVVKVPDVGFNMRLIDIPDALIVPNLVENLTSHRPFVEMGHLVFFHKQMSGILLDCKHLRDVIKLDHPISRLSSCNLKLQLIKPAALSAFSLKSHSLWAQPQWYFQTVKGGLPVLSSQGQHREGALSRRQSSSVPPQQVACLNYTPNSQNVIDEFRKHVNSMSIEFMKS